MSRLVGLSVALIVAQLATAAAQPHLAHTHGRPTGQQPAAVPAKVADTAPTIDPSLSLVFGDPVAFGQGTARTVVATRRDGTPGSVGVSFSASALDGLPTDPPADDVGWLHRLPLPSGVAVPPYDHIALYWNPRGHEPHGVYDVAHIDVHFFMTSPEQADGITAMDRDLERCFRLPPANMIPPGFMLPPNTQHRRMGVHWIDARAEELGGAPFTSTFILGSYDHAINFLEPMIARAYLVSRPNVTRTLAQPAAVARAGWYPSTWTIRWDRERSEYLVLLDGLTWRDATPTMTTRAPE